MSTTPQGSTVILNQLREALRQTAFQRNLRTAAVVGLAASGGLLSAGWLAATAGSSFAALAGWRLLQLSRPTATIPKQERQINEAN